MKRKIIAACVALVAALALVLGYRAAAAEPQPTLSAVLCPAGADLLVHPDGTWDCGATPSPTATPTPSATQTPTPAPTTPSPTPTTPSPSPSTTSAPPTPPATPTPSPTTTARLTNCMTRLDACGYPSPTTTGVPATVTLQPYLGPIPLVITTPGTVLDGKTLPCVVVKAANVTIRNSRITGSQCWGNISVDAGNVTVENTTIDCVDQRGTGIDNQNFVARRVQIVNCQNGFDVYGSNITIEDSYVTGVGGGDGHGDGLQMNNGTNMLVRHNTFDLPGDLTSSLIMGFNAVNLTVSDNFFSGGAFSVYCSRANTNAVYSGNRFYPYVKGLHATDSRSPAFGTNTNCAGVPGITWRDNYADNNLSVVSAA